ncbi:GTPase Der [Arsenophonus endosymbiont of Aleurodicus dispersus]|uniref:ribosome biogenesis GTPase Der n=1 Tax=Arsenophonus endosymbiont of Aleurodicus dispersus TaxID=235559 RepID=UPI000EB53864|nr:ribosome biogenesis GTPase Der [Arsenophonus endosymbiont of Aleurodicus dispersus]VAY02427.1 GTPase Der [Arsenophonus endosymbiont of Aleurodicus dispersus]
MIPIIALVGRPNVGKSTLFNRLTRTRDALVADFPGLTRDRKYGKATFAKQEFIVIDTGGIDGSENGIEIPIASQTLLAIEEADIVFFMVDARSGLMPTDHEIAKHLHSRKKYSYLVANKTDGLEINTGLGDFYALGIKDIYPIAASHGRGINQLVKKLASTYSSLKLANNIEFSPEKSNAAYLLAQEEKNNIYNNEEKVFNQRSLPIKLAIVGQPNVGKSTLTNRILGEDRVVIYNIPGTTRDSIYIPMERDGCEYILIDTAGVRKRGKITETFEKFSVIKTLQSIDDANVVLLVIDAREGISSQDLSLLGFILNAGRSFVIVFNKMDSMSQEARQSIKDMLDLRLGFINFAKVHFISALHGSGIGNLFESIHEAYESATRRISTSLLTRIMKIAEEKYQPPLIQGRRVKMKYAHAGGYNPPTVVIHGNQVAKLPDSYKRYLINYFRRTLQVTGTPIRIQFKEGDNPYAGKKNKLTSTYLHKRKLLITHRKKINDKLHT